MTENTRKNLLPEGTVGSIVGATAGTLLSERLKAKHLAATLAKLSPTKAKALGLLSDVASSVIGGVAGAGMERKVREATTQLKPAAKQIDRAAGRYLEQKVAAMSDNSGLFSGIYPLVVSEKLAIGMKARTVFGSKFLGDLAGGNVKRLTSATSAAEGSAKAVGSGLTRTSSGPKISAKKYEAAKRKGNISSADDMLLKSSSKTELTPGQKSRKAYLQKKLAPGFFERRSRKKGVGKVQKGAGETAARFAQSLEEETARVKSSRTKAGVAAAAGALGLGAYKAHEKGLIGSKPQY